MMSLIQLKLTVALMLGLAACTGERPDKAQRDMGGADDVSLADVVAPGDASGSKDVGGDAFCPVVAYEACGGDLLGTWEFRSLCPDDPAAAAALCEHLFDDREICTGNGNEALCDGQMTGTLTFHEDLSIDIDVVNTLVATWHFTDECLADVQPGLDPAAGCASIGNDRLTCSYDTACTCVGDPIEQADNNTATYAVVDGDLTIGEDAPASYCVVGDRLTMDYYLYHPVSWRYWVLERPEAP